MTRLGNQSGLRIATPASLEPNAKSALSVQATLADVVTLTRQFQRAVRIDGDVGNISALTGYICQGTARNVLDGTARHIVHTPHRAFTWTGPFGGGKSSLALALCSLVSPDRLVRRAALDVLAIEQSTNQDIQEAFSCTPSGWLVLPIVGYRGSVVDELAACLDKRLGTKIVANNRTLSRQRTTAILKTLAGEAERRPRDGVLLILDELGKFLEASALDGHDIYLYQELAEAASRCKGKLVVVGILHQSFEQYANRLSSDLRNEWRKVQGRYIDIPLIAASDEVVELTARAISSNQPHTESWAISKRVADSIRHRRPGLNPAFAQSLDRCWPLHPVTAALLGPVSRRRFGQNERSTFGFLASAETRTFKEFLHSTPASAKATYTPAIYWDYLRANLGPSILASPDSHRWAQSVDAVERTEQKQIDGPLHLQLVKTIALIDLFRDGSGLVADEDMLATCISDERVKNTSIDEIRQSLNDLRRWAIILYKRHLGSWCITEGSDFDLDLALTEALSAIEEPDLQLLSSLVKLRPVLAKRHYCSTGTLRWMLPLLGHATQVSEWFGNASALDSWKEAVLAKSGAFGIFLLVLPSRNGTDRQILARVRQLEVPGASGAPLLIGIPRNGQVIMEFGRELVAYEQIRRSRSELENDAVARRELDARTTEVRARLEEELQDAFLNVQWLGDQKSSATGRSLKNRTPTLAQLASSLADQVFCESPHIFSELINRDSPSSNSVKARRELLYAMLRGADKPRLGLDGYPPEVGLYYNVLYVSGLHRPQEGSSASSEPQNYGFTAPLPHSPVATRAHSFSSLWTAAAFLVFDGFDAIQIPRLYDLWEAPPFGVRPGVLPVLCLAFLIANQNRTAVYKDGMFIPQLREIDIDELLQDPSRFVVKRVEINGNRRRILEAISSHMKRLGQQVSPDPLEAARGLVALLYGLPQWTLRTNRLSEKARMLRDTLAKASDPHKVLFVDLPILFEGTSDSEYSRGLGHAIAELSNSYGDMLSLILKRTLESLDAPLDSTADIELLRRRSANVMGISGNLQLDAFAMRLTSIASDTSDTTAVEGLLSLALNKPPRDWTDRDIDAALIQLANWALQFRQIEAVSAVQGRAPTRNAFAVVFGIGNQGKSVVETFDVSPSEERRIDQITDTLMLQLKGVPRDVFLAALAQAGTRAIHSRSTKEHRKR